jgi:hypothetical protein
MITPVICNLDVLVLLLHQVDNIPARSIYFHMSTLGDNPIPPKTKLAASHFVSDLCGDPSCNKLRATEVSKKSVHQQSYLQLVTVSTSIFCAPVFS